MQVCSTEVGEKSYVKNAMRDVTFAKTGGYAKITAHLKELFCNYMYRMGYTVMTMRFIGFVSNCTLKVYRIESLLIHDPSCI